MVSLFHAGARARSLALLCSLLALGPGVASSRAQAPAPVPASASAPTPTAPGQAYALLIGGLAGQDFYGKWYADWLARFQGYLTATAHVPAANIVSLLGPAATSDAITAAMNKLTAQAKPQDQLILFIVGHGEINGPQPTLILPGPDLPAPQLAALLDAVPAKNQVVLNFSASSGDFLKSLSASGRVNLAATSPTELDEPVFAEFFLRGLESGRADTEKKGAINLLEAFNWAAQQTAFWEARWSRTSDEHATPSVWKASGKETIEIFNQLYASAPGRKLDPASNATAPDAPVVALLPPGGQITDDWANRRVLDQHALLEDGGQGLGVSVVTDKGAIQPILGQKPGDPGYLAAHTVLGQPSVITP